MTSLTRGVGNSLTPTYSEMTTKKDKEQLERLSECDLKALCQLWLMQYIDDSPAGYDCYSFPRQRDLCPGNCHLQLYRLTSNETWLSKTKGILNVGTYREVIMKQIAFGKPCSAMCITDDIHCCKGVCHVHFFPKKHKIAHLFRN